MGNTTIIKNSKTWIEGNAIEQLETTAKLPNIRHAVGLPDLHAGRGYPIGAAFFSVGRIYPALIGGDIGCGMAFWQTDLPVHQSKMNKLVKQLGSIDAPLDDMWATRIDELLPNPPFRGALGTIGGGNHFAELQAVDNIYLPDRLPENFNPQCLQLLVHSGSRGWGGEILRRHVEQFGHAGLADNTPQLSDYLAQHDATLIWAKTNRRLIAERMLAQWSADGTCLLDVHHNFVEPIEHDNEIGWLHRKGATPSNQGLVCIPGSRGDFSYLVSPLMDNSSKSLFSLAHGAGRKWRRSECKGRLSHKFSANSLRQTAFGGTVICEDKALIFEEAPQAYKKIDDVIAAMVDAHLIELVARLKPVLTYKTSGGC